MWCMKKHKNTGPLPEPVPAAPRQKDFIDLIAPGVIHFNTDHFILGNTYRCVWSMRDYPVSTSELAILRQMGETCGVTMHLYLRRVPPAEQDAILHSAANRNRMNRTANDLKRSITAESNLQDVAAVINDQQRRQEDLIHCAVFLELSASSMEQLSTLKSAVLAALIRSKLNVDHLLMNQRNGFLCGNLAGYNALSAEFERVLPASSVANLFPFCYSGKTDPHGFYIGKDHYGSNIIVDFDRRAEDKTNGHILILGNSGQGKSFLLKLLLCNFRESGKYLLALDAEDELEELCGNLDGCFMDMMGGRYRINVLEPQMWDDGESAQDADAPAAFRQQTKLSQHISFLRDFFRAYKDFDARHIDALELMVEKLYAEKGITDQTAFSRMQSEDYPILSDLYDLIEREYQNYNEPGNQLYPRELLQELLLGLHSICKGADAKFFNGYTNITSRRFLVFGVKGLDKAAVNVRNAMLFTLLAYCSDQMLSTGNTVTALDELHMWLSNPVALDYIRNILKRARKKNSDMILASQNLNDFFLPSVAEMTKPLFSIPTHHFLFNAGSIDSRIYQDNLQLKDSEFQLIRYPHQAQCLFKCGNERYLLEVKAPDYKARLFGVGGGQ